MIRRRHWVAIGAVILAVLALVPAASARATVTVDVGPAVGLFRGEATLQTVAAGSSASQVRSCEARKAKARLGAGASKGLDQIQRKGAVVACEQPPRSSLNVTGLKSAETNAIVAAG